MSLRGVWTSIQSIGVIAVCAAVAFSLSRLPNMEPSHGPMLALGGATLGIVGVCLGLLARPRVAEFEHQRSPRQLLGLRIAVICGMVAAIGWLTTVFVSASVGYWLSLVGILGGGAGVVMHNVNRSGE